MPDWLPRLDGAWQLVFSVPNRTVPAWSYIPVNEDAVFDARTRTISLASDLGPLHFDFCGDFAWDARTQVRQQLLQVPLSLHSLHGSSPVLAAWPHEC